MNDTIADVSDTVTSRAREIVAAGVSTRRRGRDPVNRPMINNWLEALGFAADGERTVPAAMAQVWTMPGLHGVRAPDDPLGAMMTVLDEVGFTSVVATDCTQTYLRPIEVGDELAVSTVLESVVGPKTTALGPGWFVTTRNTWFRGNEPVAEMTFKVLKFAPRESAHDASRTTASRTTAPRTTASADTLRPVISADSKFFWEGTATRELRVQRLRDGSLRHPPIPRVDTDPAEPVDFAVMAGTGTVHSFVVHHHPAVPGRRTPFVVALVALDEGPRMLGELRGIEGDGVRIGMRVTVDYDRIDENVTVPFWRVADVSSAQGPKRGATPMVGDVLGPMVVVADPTFVVSTALATRDFQDVHHDRDKALSRGSNDIFVNILTDTGLVQRFVEKWAGRTARFRSISLRLGVPWYAYDTLTFTGELEQMNGRDAHIRVVGSNSLGKHIVATVVVTVDAEMLS